MFIAPLQPQQQLFSGAGLKNETRASSLLLRHQQTGLHPPHTPCMDISRPLAVTPKFISPFNWISWRRVRQRGGPAGAAGVPGAWQGSHGTEEEEGEEEGWDGVAVAGCCLLHPPTHPPTVGSMALLAGRAANALFLVSNFSEPESRFHFIARENGWA